MSRAVDKANLQFRIRQLEEQVNKRHGFDTIIGQSGPIQQAITLARKVAATDTTVLLTGETGTGKEVFAQAIHQAQPTPEWTICRHQLWGTGQRHSGK